MNGDHGNARCVAQIMKTQSSMWKRRGTCNTTVTLSYPDDDGRIIAYVQSQREKQSMNQKSPSTFVMSSMYRARRTAI